MFQSLLDGWSLSGGSNQERDGFSRRCRVGERSCDGHDGRRWVCAERSLSELPPTRET